MANQFLRNTEAVLSITFSSGAADGDVIVTVTSEQGTLVETGTAIPDLVTTGRYTYPLSPQTELNRLDVAWTGAWDGIEQTITIEAEIVGAYLFTIAEARAFGDKQLADTNAYPDEDIRDARERIADEFQFICSVPFFPRYEHSVFDGNGNTALFLPYKRVLRLVAVTVNGIPLGSSDLANVYVHPSGRLERLGGWTRGQQNIAITWERGYRIVPEGIKYAALAFAHYQLVNSEITDRMVTFANELGRVRLSVPGRNNPTGIPLVDSVLNRFNDRDVYLAVR